MNYINIKMYDGYNVGTSFTEIIEDYHGNKADEQALFWKNQYGELTNDYDHIICSYLHCENLINLSVWINDDGKTVFSVSLNIKGEFEGSSDFFTIEEAIENYKETVKKCLDGEFKRIN